MYNDYIYKDLYIESLYMILCNYESLYIESLYMILCNYKSLYI